MDTEDCLELFNLTITERCQEVADLRLASLFTD